MKKRVIFVDDEALVLQGLQRMLRPMRNEWDMEFVEKGSIALERMAQASYDVVISDMMMPGMNGAELLSQVMQRSPKTVRLILSGHADRELILKCVGSAHQYLSKPCDAEMLKATVLRATSMETSTQNEKLMALVAQVETLPSLPSLYTEIIQCLQSPDFSMYDVGTIIAKDISMTAKVLKLVNSAFFGLGRRISSPVEAAAYLGADVLKALVLSANVFGQFHTAQVRNFTADALWEHSLRTAGAAKLIAKAEQVSHAQVEEAFVAGMLHDSGKLVLATNFPDQFGQVLDKMEADQLSACDAERAVFGASHAEVGGYLLGLWGLPVPVVEAIALHHSPDSSSTKQFSAVTATHVANALVHDPTGATGLDAAYLAGLGLEARLPIWKGAVQETAALPNDK